MSKKIKVNYFYLAFRNLGRHKVKTIVTCCAIAIGIMAYIFTDALMLGMNTESKRNYVNYETGSAKIYSRSYFEKKDTMPLYEGFYDYDPIIKKLNVEGFNATPHAVFNGTLLSKETEMPFIFVGVDLPKAPEGFAWKSLSEIKAYFLIPNGWYFNYEKHKNTHAYFITKEDYKISNKYITGISINAVTNIQ